jgi:hypothetical protein
VRLHTVRYGITTNTVVIPLWVHIRLTHCLKLVDQPCTCHVCVTNSPSRFVFLSHLSTSLSSCIACQSNPSLNAPGEVALPDNDEFNYRSIVFIGFLVGQMHMIGKLEKFHCHSSFLAHLGFKPQTPFRHASRSSDSGGTSLNSTTTTRLQSHLHHCSHNQL